MSVYDLDGDGQISRNDLGQMFLSSSMLVADQTMRDVVTAFVDTQFQMLQANKTITTEHITDFMRANPQKYEDGACLRAAGVNFCPPDFEGWNSRIGSFVRWQCSLSAGHILILHPFSLFYSHHTTNSVGAARKKYAQGFLAATRPMMASVLLMSTPPLLSQSRHSDCCARSTWQPSRHHLVRPHSIRIAHF